MNGIWIKIKTTSYGLNILHFGSLNWR